MGGYAWTEDDELALYRLYPRGVPVAKIAEQLGRTLSAVRAQADVYGLKRTPNAADEYTLTEVAQLVGVGAATVCRWTEIRAFPKAHRRHSKHATYKITEAELLAWLENPASWYSWRVDALPERWRDRLRNVRAGWLSTSEAAAYLGYGAAGVQGLVRQGRLRVGYRGKTWWFRREDVEGFKKEVEAWNRK